MRGRCVKTKLPDGGRNIHTEGKKSDENIWPPIKLASDNKPTKPRKENCCKREKRVK